MNRKKPLGLGLIGCGAFGQFCMEAYCRLASVRPAAVSDVRAEAADKLARLFSVPSEAEAAKLIARGDVDIVHIATPPGTHHELVLQAAKAGKHVLCEKPLAMNLAQADEMLAAAAQADVIAPVNFVLRHNPVTEAVKKIIDSGALGKVLAVSLTNCAADTYLPPEHWFWDRRVSGGILIEHGVHFFDLYSHWLGPGRVISAHAETRRGTDQQDRVMCTIRHEGGAVASHYHGFDQFGPMDRTDHRLVCELGDIRVSGWVPLTLEIDAAADDEAAERLSACCGGCDVETVEVFSSGRPLPSRGQVRQLKRRVRISYTPQADKQTLYTQSAQDLLADQIAYIRDSNHVRRITEQNGRDALALAEAAVELAES
ncbi:MAG: Gfo/Idh/MocA family oxidoreductase [Planctomycetota bacterium]|nr:Gfo/Idh/MocA family oxidoreductase [Planctomycetota bacterium]